MLYFTELSKLRNLSFFNFSEKSFLINSNVLCINNNLNILNLVSINLFFKRNLINFNFYMNFNMFIVNFLYLEKFFNIAIKGKEFSNYPDTKNHQNSI